MNEKLISLTFDDGPNNDTTPLILDILENHNIVATFFVVGSNINFSTKDILIRQINLGCEIANHSFTHRPMDKMETSEIILEIDKTNQIIREMVGFSPLLFRPPYIAVNDQMYESIKMPFISGKGCYDWEDTVNESQRVESILSQAQNGDIILLHDFSGNIKTVNALDDIIKGLIEMDFSFVTVSDLFKYKNKSPNLPYKLWVNVS